MPTIVSSDNFHAVYMTNQGGFWLKVFSEYDDKTND